MKFIPETRNTHTILYIFVFITITELNFYILWENMSIIVHDDKNSI
jgi:hypothetical protein